MNDKTIGKKSIFGQINDVVKKNLRNIIIFLSLSFILFLSFQIYTLYISNKIQKNSIAFFSAQSNDDINVITDTITNLGNDNSFYGILSTLELIKLNLEQENNQESISLYLDLLNNKKLDRIYKSAIASRASYQLIEVNFNDLSLNYSQTISSFISYIDNELDAYKGIRLELIYLTKILEAEKNNIEYKNFKDVNEMYNSIINSNVTSSATKERVNKIHEFFSNK